MLTKSRLTTSLLVVMAVLLGGFIYVWFTSFPKLEGVVKFTDEDNLAERQLSVEKKESGLVFDVAFYSIKDSIDFVTINKKLNFDWNFPFIHQSRDLVLSLVDNEENNVESEEEVYVLYEIGGTVSNVRSSEVRLKILDSFGNLVDERYFKFE